MPRARRSTPTLDRNGESMHTPVSRRILAQGDRDSACFLYSLANAAIALTGDEGDWSAAVDAISEPRAYLRAETGTQAIDLRPQKLCETADDFLRNYRPE